MAAMPVHTLILRIHYQDTDATGVVYHGAYLDFAERARFEALRDACASPAVLARDHGLAFVVRRAELRYLRPLRLDDLATLRTSALAVGGASCRLRQDFLRDGTLVTRVAIDLAAVRTDTGRPAPLPTRWRAALAGLIEPDVREDVT